MIFAAGALLSRIGLGRESPRDLWPYLAALGSFALAAASLGLYSVAFLGLFLVPTLVAAISSRISDRGLALFAASDVLLALSLTQRQAEMDLWTLPSSGNWEAGVLLAGAAGLLRLSGAALEAPGTHSFLGWWQGLLLVWWTSGSAGELLAIGGAGLAGAALLVPSHRSRGLAIGGSAAALASAAGLNGAVFAIGLAACAFVLGERAIASFVLAALPFSAVWAKAPAGLEWALAPAVAVPVLFLVLSQGLVSARAAGWGGRIPALAAAVSSAILLWQQTPLWVWAYYGLGMSALAVAWFVRPHPARAEKQAEEALVEEPLPAIRLLAGIGIASALLLWLRLVVVGLETGFL